MWVKAVLLSAVAIVVAFIGPFDTYGSGTFGTRLIYWGGAIVAALGVATLWRLLARRMLRQEMVGLQEAIVVAGTALSFTPILYQWTWLFFPQIESKRPEIWQLGVEVLGICIFISLLRVVTPVLMRAMLADPAKPQPQAVVARLARRLPDSANTNILRLTVDGHIVQVVTAGGVVELRMRFADAVDEMDPVPGHCSHRSHWVAEDAIVGSEVRSGRPVLILRNGDEVPVSRKYQPQIEAAGIL